jgi:hypothetical protein
MAKEVMKGIHEASSKGMLYQVCAIQLLCWIMFLPCVLANALAMKARAFKGRASALHGPFNHAHSFT